MKKVLIYTFFSIISLFAISQDYTDFINNYNKSAFDFYKNLSENSDNLVYSPFFLNISFSELYLASGAGTARQISEFTYFSEDKYVHVRNMLKFQKIITENQSLNTNFKFSINFFLADSLSILDKFKSSIAQYLCDTNLGLNFNLSKNLLADTINEIVKYNTNEYIQPYLKAEQIPDNPSILINSAAYFSGFWASNFSNYITSSFNLDSLGRKANNIIYLTNYDYYEYSETEEYQIIQIPYEGYKFDLVIILPLENTDYKNICDIFSFRNYSMWRQYNLQKQKVRLIIPEFEIENFYNLKDNIDTIIPAAFTKGGNFLNLIKKIVYVNGFYHYAKISVTRENRNLTELSDLDIDNESLTNNSIIFNANHPFIFMVIDKDTGAIIFMGNYFRPLQ